MSDTPALDALDVEPLSLLAQQLLDAIWFAPDREALGTALAAARAELARWLASGALSVNQARPILALLELKALDRLREWPTSAPVGLFGGRP